VTGKSNYYSLCRLKETQNPMTNNDNAKIRRNKGIVEVHFFRKSPDVHYVEHRLVKNTLPSHYVQHDDTRVPPDCRRAEKPAVSRHPGWLKISLKQVLSVEFVELSP
jgi:hypothetical protein